MSKPPSLTGKQIVAFFKKNGFVIERQKGSHVFFEA
jgi:predicted RNA binding protein YcfA (HicA-like mRNA interferase family)